MAAETCTAPSLLNNSHSVCMQAFTPLHAASFQPPPQMWPKSALTMSLALLLLIILAVTLCLLGVVSGLLLPIVLQKVSGRFRPTADANSISDDDSAHAGLQSRPLSDVDPEEIFEEDLLSHSHGALKHPVLAPGGVLTPHWQLSQDDLQRFKATVDPVKGKLLTGDLGGGWNFIMEKDQPGRMRYTSYWRPTANGKTDYLSITIVNNATAQEMHEFNMEDTSRVAWDPMLRKAWLLQSGKAVEQTAEQLVVYLRSFPMGFVTDRVYASISRREFTDPNEPGCFYTVSKVVHTPATAAWAALNYPGVTLIDDYFSAWECRTILSPWADPTADAVTEPQPACAIILLHHDDLKVPEYLARTAIKLGMWKFVQGMVGYGEKWVQQRRIHTDPFQPDPKAKGRQPAPPLSPDVAAAAAAVAHRHAPAHAAFAGATGTDSPAAAEAVSAATAAMQAAAAGAPPVIRPSRSLSNSPHSSWAGFRKLEGGDQPAGTPRVLHPVPTAPGPLHSLADLPQDSGVGASLLAGGLNSGSGVLVRGSGVLRRGHSLEWEPRVASSSNSSAEAEAPAVQGGSGSTNGSTAALQQDGNAWQRVVQGVGHAAKLPAELGSVAVGAVGGAVQQLGHISGASWHWLQRLLPGHHGNHHSEQATGAGSGSSAAGQQLDVKPQGVARLLAPAGPEDDGVAAAGSVGVGSSGRVSGMHAGMTANFGSSSRGEAGSRGGVSKRLQRLLMGAAVAAAVGAGVAAHHRKGEVVSQQQQEQQSKEVVVVQTVGKQSSRGLLPGLHKLRSV